MRCKVRDSEQYAQLVWMVSGGYIDINNDERGTRLPDGSMRMRAPTVEELKESQAAQEEARKAREAALAAQW